MSLTSDDIKRGWLKPSISVFLVTVLLPLAATALVSGKTSVEKMLTLMVQPLFIAIVSALALGCILIRSKEKAVGWLLSVGACVLWILSTSVLVNGVVGKWEDSTQTTDLSKAEPFDYLVVLGGGTSVAPDGRAQFTSAGDRVGYAARLFFSGKAKKLVTTGDNMILSGSLSGSYKQQDDPSQQTKNIWIDLGIPADVIFELAGQNTSSEIASLKQHPEYWDGKRCAILTSAIHLPRAMQLASRAEIPVFPYRRRPSEKR